MDPFEARLQFIKTLHRLNASAEANDVAITFLSKNRDLTEDLYSCVLEELNGSSVNVRLNIFYFLEAIVYDTSPRLSKVYAEWILRDLVTLVGKAVPDSRLGLVNLNAVQQVINGLRERGQLTPELSSQVQSLLDSRHAQAREAAVELTEPVPGPARQVADRAAASAGNSVASVTSGDRDTLGRHQGSNNQTTAGPAVRDSAGLIALSHEDILRRMDEDRERSKRLKETIWAIDTRTNPLAEFERFWSSGETLTALDFEQMSEDNDIAQSSTGVTTHG